MRQEIMNRVKPFVKPALFPFRLLRPKLWRTPWFWDHVRSHRSFDRRRLSDAGPIDVMVAIVDHFEPTSRRGEDAAKAAVQAWCDAYAPIAERHRDADGRMPQHTWFYRAEYPNLGCIQVLAEQCFAGRGEVEFHLHHGYDTYESFLRKLNDGLNFFNKAGAMLTTEPAPQRRFAYIAGNWALDNGAGDDSFSGCNTELTALREAGCYADFTFPALGSPAQPRKTNAIYYAEDTPAPKSYDQGRNMIAGGRAWGDLVIFQGPLVLDWWRGQIEDAGIEAGSSPLPNRLNAWLKANVHVENRPDWLFVKLHCHGIQAQREFQGPELDATFAAMCKRWNHPPFRLHFVNAREAYNIAKAAEAGMTGDPNGFRDYIVPPPANSLVRCNVPWLLRSREVDRIEVEFLDETAVSCDFRNFPVQRVAGRITWLEVEHGPDRPPVVSTRGDGTLVVHLPKDELRIRAGERIELQSAMDRL
jgi:hypothetical protein